MLTRETPSNCPRPWRDRARSLWYVGRRITVCIGVSIALCFAATVVHANETGVSFVRDVRPILSNHCFTCHGPDETQREADLRLDQPDSARSMIQPGDVDDSELIRRITSGDASDVMPPPETNKPLNAQQIETLKRWIAAGAPWGEHWSLTPLHRPQLPQLSVQPDVPVRNPIDRFVQARLPDIGLAPAREATRSKLIRRLSLDLTGLPPDPRDVREFVNDRSPDAYEKVVDRLLATVAYGERMTWDWLDAARYADSNGYQGDRERSMWPWRDWVVKAFNQDLPFDDFTVWQLAGDLLPAPGDEMRLATGFCRNHMINGEGGRIPEENRVDYVMDMAETTGTVWLALTLNCCRCHDHKFDPLTRRDYYSFFAFFNQTPVDGSGGDPQTRPVLELPSPAQQQQLDELQLALDPLLKQRDALPEDQRPAELSQQIEQAEKALQQAREAVPKVMIMADRSEPRPTFMLDRGLYNQPGEPVTASLPASLSAVASDAESIPNRLTLARWLVGNENPLTARVIVNRFWQHLFGMGLVKTSEDFGAQGEIPVHEELLDWLAVEFRDSGWNVKSLLRCIVTSHTYRQDSYVSADAAQRDPQNRWLARGARFRLPSWMIRDQALAISGLLDDRIGGPGVNPYQPDGVWEEATFGNKKYQLSQGADLYRRSLYTFWRRIIAPTPFFDSATRQTCTVKVARTNTPLHALALQNDVTYVEAARHLAEKLLQSSNDDDHQRLNQLYDRVFARPATDDEQDILMAGLARTRAQFAANPHTAGELLSQGESSRDTQLDCVEFASWTTLCLTVLNLDETITRE